MLAHHPSQEPSASFNLRAIPPATRPSPASCLQGEEGVFRVRKPTTGLLGAKNRNLSTCGQPRCPFPLEHHAAISRPSDPTAVLLSLALCCFPRLFDVTVAQRHGQELWRRPHRTGAKGSGKRQLPLAPPPARRPETQTHRAFGLISGHHTYRPRSIPALSGPRSRRGQPASSHVAPHVELGPLLRATAKQRGEFCQ